MKNRRGDADFTPLRVATRRREKYYTKQFSKVGKSVTVFMKKQKSPKPKTNKNSFGLVKICDGPEKFKHGYTETIVCNSDSG